MNKNVYFVLGAGFLAGALIGFVYGTGVRSNLSGAISTGFENGAFVIRTDIKDALTGGILDTLNKG